jgi:hypothetical protein
MGTGGTVPCSIPASCARVYAAWLYGEEPVDVGTIINKLLQFEDIHGIVGCPSYRQMPARLERAMTQ